MIPEPNQCVSFLTGAAAIADADLTGIGVTILQGAGSGARDLLVPASALAQYSALVRERLDPGFWNEIVGREQILFIVKLPDGTVRDLALSPQTSPEIARLCSALNGDPIEQTSDVPRYLAGNPLYRDVIRAFHASGSAVR